MTLDPSQAAAVQGAIDLVTQPNKRVMSVVGPAGTGKTFTTRAIIDVIEKMGKSFVICAPTHKAAGVARRATGRPASTIQSFLKAGMVRDLETGEEFLATQEGAFSDEDEKLPDVVLCDEGSMVGNAQVKTAAALSKHRGVKFIFVGDSAQLPPVNENASLTVDDKRCPWEIFKLSVPWRQGEGNPILDLATATRESPGNFKSFRDFAHPLGTKLNKRGVHILGKSQFAAHFKHLAELGAWREEDPDFSKLCSYTNKYADRANRAARIHVYGDDAKTVPYLEGERVAIGSRYAPKFDPDNALTNGLDAVVLKVQPCIIDSAWLGVGDEFSGVRLRGFRLTLAVTYDETGQTYEYVVRTMGSYAQRDDLMKFAATEANQCKKEWPSLTVAAHKRHRYKQPWRKFFAIQDSIADVRPVFATTTHKSQGSTYKYTFIDLSDMSKMSNDYNRLLYVAETRATHAVYLTGVL